MRRFELLVHSPRRLIACNESGNPAYDEYTYKNSAIVGMVWIKEGFSRLAIMCFLATGTMACDRTFSDYCTCVLFFLLNDFQY